MATNQIDAQLECPICRDRFQTPKMLPCQHVFCLVCLQRLSQQGSVIQCPECRANHQVPSSGVSDFPTSIPIQRILEASPPSSSTSQWFDATSPQSNRRTGSLEEQSRTENTQVNCRQTLSHLAGNVRQTLRHLAGKILNDQKILLSAFIIAFSVVSVSRFAAGAAKLSSDCPLEGQAAVYLFVKACFGSFFWGVLVVWTCKRSLKQALDNIFVEVYLVLESLFSISWLFVGTARIMGNYNSIINHCPEYVNNWNAHFINFGLFLTVVDYIGLIVFLFYCGYTLCDSDEENQEA